MDWIRFICRYFKHVITARNTKGFGVHSPFIYQFVRFVIYEKYYFYSFSSIENIRKKLKTDRKIIDIQDFGTGNDRRETVSRIAKHSLKSEKYGRLFFRIINYYKFRQILELGTSLGITTSYLASSSNLINCVSLEGSSEIANVALENFKALGLNNIQVAVGNIDNTLNEVLNEINELDFVFFDANHQSNAVLNYIEKCLPKAHQNSIFVIDDIHWSNDMELAWEIIKKNPAVTSTIDLFQLGIVFFNKDLYKKHYKMRF